MGSMMLNVKAMLDDFYHCDILLVLSNFIKLLSLLFKLLSMLCGSELQFSLKLKGTSETQTSCALNSICFFWGMFLFILYHVKPTASVKVRQR